MGLFGKKKRKESDLPDLPEFPRLPEEQAPSYQPELQGSQQARGPLPASQIPALPKKFEENIDPIKTEAKFFRKAGFTPMEPQRREFPKPDYKPKFSPVEFSRDDMPRPSTYDDRMAKPMPFDEMQEMPYGEEAGYPEHIGPVPSGYEDEAAPQRSFQPMQEDEMPAAPLTPAAHEHGAIHDKALFIKIEEYRDALSNLQLLRKKIQEVESYIERLESIKAAEDAELKKCRENIDAVKSSLLDVDKKLFEV